MTFKISAIVVADDSLSAAGATNLFLPVPDRPAVRRCVESLVAAKVSEILVTAGQADRDKVGAALEGLAARVVLSDGSLRAGLKAIDPSSTAVLLFPVEHSLVCSATIEDLLEEHPFCPENILVLLFDGKQGQPSLFPRQIINEVLSGLSLAEVIAKYSSTIRYLVTDDDGTVLTATAAEDNERLRRILASGQT